METQPGTIFGRKPALVLALVQAVIALVVAFGLNVAPNQIGAILAVTAVVLGLITRSRVSPTLLPRSEGRVPARLAPADADRPPGRRPGGVRRGGGSVADAAARVSVRPSTAKRHLADLRARSGFTTDQLIYRGRAEGRLVVEGLESRDQTPASRSSARPASAVVVA